MNRNLLTIAASLGLLWGGCAEPRPPLTVTSDDIRVKVLAIQRAVDANDRSVIPQLVQDLDNDDPAVRFYAFEGLQRLTGQTFGYRYFDDRAARQPALKRWNDWLAAQGAATPTPTTRPAP